LDFVEREFRQQLKKKDTEIQALQAQLVRVMEVDAAKKRLAQREVGQTMMRRVILRLCHREMAAAVVGWCRKLDVTRFNTALPNRGPNGMEICRPDDRNAERGVPIEGFKNTCVGRLSGGAKRWIGSLHSRPAKAIRGGTTRSQ